MRRLAASLVAALLLAPLSARADDSTEVVLNFRAPLTARSAPTLCGRGKLDLPCPTEGGGRWIQVRRADPRFERNAVTIRFGPPSRDSPSRVEVQVGSLLHRALFIAALVAWLL